MKLNSFKNLLLEELRDLYDAERQLIKALPNLAEAAVLPQLKEAFIEHLEATKRQADRLEQIFKQFGESPKGNPCKTMHGLIAEAQDVLDEEKNADPGVFEAALIADAQKIEHFEIAAYGTARTYARILGLNNVAELLGESLEEESASNKLLNEIAMQSVNPEAAEATRDEKNLNEAVVAVLEVSH